MDSSTPILPKRLHIRDSNHNRHRNREDNGGSKLAGLNATLGLVIHGAADGIALGASSLSGKGSLGLIVFLAVLVHKGDSARPLPSPVEQRAVYRRLLYADADTQVPQLWA